MSTALVRCSSSQLCSCVLFFISGESEPSVAALGLPFSASATGPHGHIPLVRSMVTARLHSTRLWHNRNSFAHCHVIVSPGKEATQIGEAIGVPRRSQVREPRIELGWGEVCMPMICAVCGMKQQTVDVECSIGESGKCERSGWSSEAA